MRHILPLLLAASALLSPRLAAAGAVELSNTTTITGSDGQATSFVGEDFQTTGVALSTTRQGSGYALTLAYTTTFSGLATSGDVSTAYPDIFLRAPEAGYGTQPFTYAVALGDETQNGGQPAGFYTPASVATSQSIWSGRSGYIYGAAYGATAGGPDYAAPVVMLSGQKIGGTGVTSTTVDTHMTYNGLELYSLDVTISGLGAALATTLGKGFDAFWGTGDCANGAFLATYSGDGTLFKQIPEPGTLPVALSGLAVLVLTRRRRASGRQGLLF